jgi:flagellar FliL protein
MAEKKAAAEEKEEKKGGKLKLIIILLVFVALVAGGGFAAWFFLIKTPEDGEGNNTKVVEEKIVRGPMVNLDPFVVNLADPIGRRYLKTTMDVEVVDAAAAAALSANMPRIKDTILLLLSSKTFADIDSLDKKLELKDEIVERMNLIVGQGKIINLYFTEFVIQ